tara:strand:- start:80 stop:385 length:306 start_codon:yes stop_codon:yes gene_type:complete
MRSLDSGAKILGRVIQDFPYPERECALCSRPLQLVNAIHSDQDVHHFKAIYVCGYESCEAFDYEGRKAYVKLYYSSEEAHIVFEDVMLPVYGRREKTSNEN